MPDHILHVVGQNPLQNELLGSFLEKKIDAKITTSTAFHQTIFSDDSGVKQLILFDCMSITIDSLWTKMGSGTEFFPSECLISFFNVERTLGIEKDAVGHGIRGIFYANEPLDIFVKGVKAIFEGELWYSRKTVSKCLLEARASFKAPASSTVSLTHREKEILIEIASGASNQDIADALFLSLHTVKTHIYNIYKKIKVSNRLQATLWAAKHL